MNATHQQLLQDTELQRQSVTDKLSLLIYGMAQHLSTPLFGVFFCWIKKNFLKATISKAIGKCSSVQNQNELRPVRLHLARWFVPFGLRLICAPVSFTKPSLKQIYTGTGSPSDNWLFRFGVDWIGSQCLLGALSFKLNVGTCLPPV